MSTHNDIILESISDGVFTVDMDWKITSFNRAAERITGISRDEAIGSPCFEVFRSNMCESECPLKRTMRSSKPIINRSGYIVNPKGKRIPISVSTALLLDKNGRTIGGAETFRDLSEIEELKTALKARSAPDMMTSASPAMKKIQEMLPAVADSPSTVFIHGETGTGKEVLARTIHAMSPRRSEPFVAINCGALPDTLLESELFGYKKGAFTGAERDKPGRFALAGKGTIFLDEIGELSPALQVKLLRVLQEGEFEPLGSTRSEKSAARIICATNRDLMAMVEDGSFRRDLYYRVHVIAFELPPLRKRREDIVALSEYFLSAFNRQMNRNIAGFSPEVYARFYDYPWPGNIRELENVIERAVVLCAGKTVEPACLPREFSEQVCSPPAEGSIGSAVEHTQRQAIVRALERCSFNRTAAAKELGIDKTTLYRKIRALGIELPPADGRNG